MWKRISPAGSILPIMMDSDKIGKLPYGDEAIVPVKRSQTEYPMTKNGAYEMLKNVLPAGTMPRDANARKSILKTILTKYSACFELDGSGIWLDETCLADKREDMLKLFEEMYLFTTKF